MRSLKSTLVLILMNISLFAFGQLNPINDLFYEQNYWFMNSNCPAYNCFELTWLSPEPSNDTLIGYKVYKNNVFWVFTEETDVTCSGYVPCEYPDFFDYLPFWITVKAVYNSDSSLSIANDSIEVIDIMITVEEITQDKITVLKNPISAGENISLIIPDALTQPVFIKVYSLRGELLKDLELNNHCGGIIHFSSTNLSQGLHVIKILWNGKSVSRKILLE